MTTIVERTAGLAAFVRTIDSGSFSGAGRLLGASASAVSKSVARLERRLGVRLIKRTTRALVLTAEGAAYYERVAPLLRAIEDAEDIVRLSGEAHGLLRVTVPTEIGRMLMAAWIEPFMARHPQVKIQLSVTDRRVDLVREGFDVAVRVGPPGADGAVAHRLPDLPMVLVAAPAYAARRGLPQSPDELQAHAVLRYLDGGNPAAIEFGDGTSLVGDGPLDTDDGAALRESALCGSGIAALTRMAVADDLAAGRLVEVLPQTALPSRPLHVVHAFGLLPPARARIFIDALAERLTATSAAPAAPLSVSAAPDRT